MATNQFQLEKRTNDLLDTPITSATSSYYILVVRGSVSLDLANVGNGDAGISAAVIALGGDDLVVVVAIDVQPGLAPGIEVAAGLHGSARALVDADGPVLVKGANAVDTRFVDAGALAEAVGAAVAVDCAQVSGSG